MPHSNVRASRNRHTYINKKGKLRTKNIRQNPFGVHKVIMFSYFKTATTLLFAHVLKVVTAQKSRCTKSFWTAKGKQTLAKFPANKLQL